MLKYEHSTLDKTMGGFKFYSATFQPQEKVHLWRLRMTIDINNNPRTLTSMAYKVRLFAVSSMCPLNYGSSKGYNKPYVKMFP